MADINDLTVRNVLIRDDVSTAQADFGKPLTLVTFFVGSHGPFRLVYPKDQATSDKIRGDIDHQVVEIRRITGQGY